MTTYTLQTTVMYSGTLTVKIVSSDATLTMPVNPTIISISPVSERMDSASPGLSDMQQVTFKVMDDYTTYTEGFWYKVLALDFQIQLLLDEGSGNTYVFWGRLIEPASTFEELSLVTGAPVRVAEFSCASMLTALKDTTMTTLFTECDTHEVTAASSKKYLKLHALLASMLATTFSQAYSTNDVIMTADDFKYKEGANYWTFTDVSIQTENAVGTDVGYRVDWPTEYANCFDLLSALCKAFGFYPEYYYDISAVKHRIRLITRGRTYSTPLTFASAPSSSSTPRERSNGVTSVVVDGSIQVQSSSGGWFITGNGTGGSQSGQAPLPAGLEADASLVIFHATSSVSGPDDYTLYYLSGGGATAQKITAMQYYNYTTAAFSSDVTPSSGEAFQQPLLNYVFQRFKRGSGKKAFEREYSTIKASDGSTSTHTHIKMGNLISVNDGVSTRTYYISEIEKDIQADSMRLVFTEV